MDLAVFSGAPFFQNPQHVGGPIVEPEVRQEFHRLSEAAFAKNWLTNSGPLSIRLEEEVAARHRAAEAVFVANATLAQLLLMKALGLNAGEALVSANTFIATAHVCEWLGLKPVFCDIDPGTLNLSAADCRRKITGETRCLIPTHVFGVFADLPALTRLAAERRLVLLADAAHAFDCDLGGIPPGGFGIPEFLSFHATKYFSTLEGGAILTGDRSLARELRELRNFGFDRPEESGKCGLNAKASEISAAFGLASLPVLERRRQRLREARETYERELAGVPGLRIHPVDRLGRNNYRYFSLFVEEEAFGLSRDELSAALRRENVLARSYFHPGCHRMPHYRKGGDQTVLPQADLALGRILSLPTSFADGDPLSFARDIAILVKRLHDRAGEARQALKRLAAEA
jgi:dTDP-4-amino-4,6-dideoxyglucose